MVNTTFHLQPSRYFLFISLCLLCSTFLVIIFSSISFFIKMICVLLLLVNGYQWLQKIFLMQTFAVHTLSFSQNKTWMITTKHKEWTCQLSEQSIITRFVSVLRFKTTTSSRTLICIVFCDALPITSYQRLLMLLRFS